MKIFCPSWPHTGYLPTMTVETRWLTLQWVTGAQAAGGNLALTVLTWCFYLKEQVLVCGPDTLFLGTLFVAVGEYLGSQHQSAAFTVNGFSNPSFAIRRLVVLAVFASWYYDRRVNHSGLTYGAHASHQPCSSQCFQVGLCLQTLCLSGAIYSTRPPWLAVCPSH